MELSKTNIAKAILIYYWIAIGLLELGVPPVIEPKLQTWLTFACLGFLAADYFKDGIEEQLLFLQSALDGPKVMTNWGVYNWDGVTYTETISGDPYCILKEGVSFLGQILPGERTFICPRDHLKDVGKHRLIMTDLEWVTGTALSGTMDNFSRDSKWTFKGDVISAYFGDPDPEHINLSRRCSDQTELINHLSKTNAEYQKVLSDSMMMLKNTQPQQQPNDPDYDRLIELALANNNNNGGGNG